jgi:transcriptional regulator GlxA family with amidase domain
MQTTDLAVARAVLLMKQDLRKKWTVTALAKAVGMSRPVLARRFLAAFGCGPIHYLTRLRMDAAAAALESTDDRLAVIARGVGYETEFALSRAFRRRFGVPPASYRRGSRTLCRAA